MGGAGPGEHLQVVGVDAGDPGGVQVGRPAPDHVPDLLVALRGDDLHIEAHGLLPKEAVLHVHLLPHRRGHLIPDLRQPLHHGGVAGGNVGAHPQQADGDFSGDAVQVPPLGHAALRQVLLVPAHAQQAGGMVLGDPLPAHTDDGLDGVHPKQGQILLKQHIVEQVHVGVREAGEHLPPLQVDDLVPVLGQGLLVGPQKYNCLVLHPNGLTAAHGAGHRVHLAVAPKSAHVGLLLRLGSFHYTGFLKKGQRNSKTRAA